MDENAVAEYYFVDAQGSRNGPISEADFINGIAAGTISPETPVWRTGEPDWHPLKTVRDSWFPSFNKETSGSLVPERLNADTSLAALFSDTWDFLFSGNNFWLLLVGGILWVLIEASISTLGVNATSLATSFVSTLAFLIFLRKWDRGESPTFSDLFPLKQFFFLPWLRSLGASALAVIATAIPLIIAGIIGGLAFISVNETNPELNEHLRNLDATNTCLREIFSSIPEAGEFPQISTEAESTPDDAGSTEVILASNFTPLDFIQTITQIAESAQKDLCEIVEILLNSSTFRFSLVSFALLAVVSIFLSVRLAFVSYFPLDAETGIIDSLKYSWQLSAGKFWKIFIFGFLLGLFSLIGTLITLGLGYLILCPYVLVAFPVLYAKLIKARPELQIPPSRL